MKNEGAKYCLLERRRPSAAEFGKEPRPNTGQHALPRFLGNKHELALRIGEVKNAWKIPLQLLKNKN
jgi:hypothetical protein